MKSPNITCLVNMPRQIPFAKILHETCPHKLKIVVTNFSAVSEFTKILQWKKHKSFAPCLSPQDIEELKEDFGDDLTVCNNSSSYDKALSDCDICLSDGREFIVLLPQAFKIKKYVALSSAYISRLLNVLPIYNGKLFITCESETNYNDIIQSYYSNTPESEKSKILNVYKKVFPNLENCQSFEDIDLSTFFIKSGFMSENYNFLKKIKKDAIKKELGIPVEKKIALFSCRKAIDSITFFDSDKHFISQNKAALQELKDLGYYIISRKRTGGNDKGSRQQTASEPLLKLGLIDKEINSFKGFPSMVFKLCYISDVLLLADISALGSIEGLICKTPSFLPSIKYPDNCQSIFKHMIEEGACFNKMTHESLSKAQKNINKVKNKWYNFDISLFWKNVLK